MRGRRTHRDMPVTQKNYFDFVDHGALAQAYPVADFLDRYQDMSSDELRATQDARFRDVMDCGWRVPFYRRLWQAQGIERGDIQRLDDLSKLPVYSKSDLMTSVEAHPPIGDFHGLDSYPSDTRPPVIFHTTSGTTGMPQPLIWGPKSREVQNMLLAQLYLLQGMKRTDVVHSVYGFGLVNGGHYIREAIQHWVGAQVMTAGTGAETRSEQQVHLMRDFRATVLVGFGDYLHKLADTARDQGLTPGEDIRIRMISGHVGSERIAGLAEAWGTQDVYDWYGVGDTGAIAGQGPDRDGMHLMEDAQLVEVLDPETLMPVPDGETGDLICTCLYKEDLFPVIRFQTHDLTQVLSGANPLRLPFRRIAGHLGRSDSMVKLRGVTVYPHGIGAILAGQFGISEFVCRVTTPKGQAEMTVLAETARPSDALAAQIGDALRTRLGVRITVETVLHGTTAPLTGLEQRQKPKRLSIEDAPA